VCKGKSRSRFPEGMTERKVGAKAETDWSGAVAAEVRRALLWSGRGRTDEMIG
jgi:hypothetical protein